MTSLDEPGRNAGPNIRAAHPSSADIRLDYASTSAFMTMLVQVRFSTAALYMAAAAFLVAAHFAANAWEGYPILIPLLGLVTTACAWILDIRTEALVKGLAERGAELERQLALGKASGFFHSMTNPQIVGVRMPFFRNRFTNDSALLRYIFSYSFALELLYLAFLLFWLNAAWIAR